MHCSSQNLFFCLFETYLFIFSSQAETFKLVWFPESGCLFWSELIRSFFYNVQECTAKTDVFKSDWKNREITENALFLFLTVFPTSKDLLKHTPSMDEWACNSCAALATEFLLRGVLGHPRRLLGSLDLESSEQYRISATALSCLCLGKCPVQQKSSAPVAPDKVRP